MTGERGSLGAERLARLQEAIEGDGVFSAYARLIGVPDLLDEIDRLAAALAASDQALDFCRGTLEDIGSSLMPVRDGDALRTVARRALDVLDDYWPASAAERAGEGER